MAVEQQQLPLGKVNSTQFQPVSHVQEGARAYAASRGMSYDPEPGMQVQANGIQGYAGYRATKAAIGQPLTDENRRSYDALTPEVNAQFEHMTKPVEHGGMGMKFEVSDTDPYDSPQAMAHDVEHNRRIKVLSTAATGGHAIWDNETNDRFRAVHDVFGHAGVGRDFSRNGEEGAYVSHAQMFSEHARPALASETRMQNTYLNWGGGDFPPNAPMNAPGWMIQANPEPPAAPKRIKSSRAEQPSLF